MGGSSPSYEICDCCSFQFGVSDDNDGYSFQAWRARWIADGMRWDEGRSEPPAGWDPVEQLNTVLRH